MLMPRRYRADDGVLGTRIRAGATAEQKTMLVPGCWRADEGVVGMRFRAGAAAEQGRKRCTAESERRSTGRSDPAGTLRLGTAGPRALTRPSPVPERAGGR
ncbi:hypothetical protein ACWEPH_17735 [Nocardia beijingensis]